jgi:hypothetical protein
MDNNGIEICFVMYVCYVFKIEDQLKKKVKVKLSP